MLKAFITPAGWDRLSSLLEHMLPSGVTDRVGPEPGLDNLWLLSTGIYDAFREGEIHLVPRAEDDPFAPSHPPGCVVALSSKFASVEAACLHQSVSLVLSAKA